MLFSTIRTRSAAILRLLLRFKQIFPCMMEEPQQLLLDVAIIATPCLRTDAVIVLVHSAVVEKAMST